MKTDREIEMEIERRLERRLSRRRFLPTVVDKINPLVGHTMWSERDGHTMWSERDMTKRCTRLIGSVTSRTEV